MRSAYYSVILRPVKAGTIAGTNITSMIISNATESRKTVTFAWSIPGRYKRRSMNVSMSAM